MYKISKETKAAYLFMFSIVLWLAACNKVSFFYLIIFPFSYTVMYFYISIFIWDKRKQFGIMLSENSFRKNDLISTGRNGQQAIILKVTGGKNNAITATCYPLKVSKYRIVRMIRFWYIKASYWLRTVVQ